MSMRGLTLTLTLTLSAILTLSYCEHTHDAHSSDRGRRLQQLYNHFSERELEEAMLKVFPKSKKGSSEFDNIIREWLDQFELELEEWTQKQAEAEFNFLTNLTEENGKRVSEISVEMNNWQVQYVMEGKMFLQHEAEIADEKLKRALDMIVYFNAVPPTEDENMARAMSSLQTKMEGIYGNAHIEKDGVDYSIEPGFTQLMQTSRDWDERLWGWKTWRDLTGPKMRPLYTELVELMNKAAQDFGFNDASESWVYVWKVDNFEEMIDNLFEEIKPVYEQLHAYVRRGLIKQYPEQQISETEPMPAHVVGDMWSQQWTSMIDFLLPYPEFPSYDVTDTMIEQGFTALDMFKMAEKFFVSTGLEKMTPKFWNNSMIEKPPDRPVQCHASAMDMGTGDDFRIKMCTEVTMEELQTIHHEMGHIEYFMLYKDQDVLYRDGANPAFHEAVGDTIALSVMTPEHLATVGLLTEQRNGSHSLDDSQRPIDENDINFLMKMALEKIAFLPFGYVIDKYRWQTMRGEINQTNYTQKYWHYRELYQGLKAPIPRSEEDFDPGSKYHVATNVRYIRYFLSFIAQFQFQEALCKAKGHRGPLHRCDIFQSQEAGDLLRAALSLGSSKEWPKVMETLTGQRQFKVDGLINYFRPLLDWLQEQNDGRHVGWSVTSK